MPVAIPIKGTEAGRAATVSIRKVGEIHTTQPNNRVFLKDVCVSDGKWLGSVPNQAAMLLLNVGPMFCFPGDFVYREDTLTVWLCITNRGAVLGDWFQFPAGSFTGTASDIPYDPTASGLSSTDVQAALDEISAAVPPPPDAIDVPYDHTSSGLTATDLQAAVDELAGSISGTNSGNILYLFNNYH